MEDNDLAPVIGAVIAGVGLALDDEDDDIEERRRQRIQTIHVDVDGYRNLEDTTFAEHFRMNRRLFESLLVLVGGHLQNRGRLVRLRTPLDLSLMMTLWILATPDTFRSVAVKFNVPCRGTVHYNYVVIIEALREMAPRFVKWPDEFERDNIKASFERRYHYPGVVGCIDGSHIYISAPLIQPQRYVNRFRKTSMLLQAVCDHRLVFRDIFVGQPGSVHDSRMFQRSPLSNRLLHDPTMLTPDEHILGDGAYTLTDKVITPYRDVGNMTRRQRRHNYVHASCRSPVENSFALYKGKWRRQKYMLIYCLEYTVDTIVASCVLHNFLLLDGQPYFDDVEDQADLVVVAAADREEDDDGPVLPEVDPALQPARQAGRLKRDLIAEMIYPHD